MQLAFSGSIRVDDVVVVGQQWGRIEEITLTDVVVHLWDDRRFVLPSTSFTSTPFENWTRTDSELLGAVEFDLDWRVSPADVRTELDRILDWIQRNHPDALPLQRVQVTEPTAQRPAARRSTTTEYDSQLFREGDERTALSTGPVQTAGIRADEARPARS